RGSEAGAPVCPACAPSAPDAGRLGQHARGMVSLHLRTLAREGRMTVTIGRRELLAALGGAAAAWPLPGAADARPRLAFLALGPQQNVHLAFVDGLRRLGYAQSRNFDIDHR